MFGIGLPELLVILAVALIVVGPEKLPELAKSLAKGLGELKKTVSQVKEGFNEEGNVLKDVKGELNQTVGDLQRNFLDTETKTKKVFPNPVVGDDEVIDLALLSSDERPWEKDRKKEPAETVSAMHNHSNGQQEDKEEEKQVDDAIEETQEKGNDDRNEEMNKK